MKKLAGKTALVTGASGGLGLEIARALADTGAHVVLHGRRESELARAEQDLKGLGASTSTLVADLVDEQATQFACRAFVERHGGIDFLINNAGARDRRPLQELDRAAFRALLEVNLVAPYDLVRQLAPYMPDGGRVVNITSIAGPIARAGDAGYTAAKGGLDALTRALAADLGARAITVNAVAPGFFATEANAAMAADPAIKDWLSRRTSLGRWGLPNELAGAVVFLCSPEAAFMTGVTLPVDGGYLAHF